MSHLLFDNNSRYIVLFLTLLVAAAIACGESDEGGKDFDVENAPPTVTVSPVTMQEIEDTRQKLTELQWDEYRESLAGARIKWTATVSQIDDDGTLYLDAGEDSIFTTCYLDGISKETAMKINKDQVVEFEATITKVDDLLGLSVWLDNPTQFSVQ